MLFTRLRMNHFGKFHNYELELRPGINLIYGENEAGKSTVHTFMKGMLFGIERARGRGAATKDDLYMKYLPWEYPGAYRGQMDILLHDKEYRLLRSFHANDKSFTVLDLETGREVKLAEGLISELIPGLTEATYRNTVSIGQLSARTDAELASQVRNYITNLSVTKSKEVDVTKAVTSLNLQKKALEAAEPAEELRKLAAEIEEGNFREEKLNDLMSKLRQLLAEETEHKDRMQTVTEGVSREMLQRMEQLPAILEKYDTYRELVRQGQLLETQIEELQRNNSQLTKEAGNADSLREELKEARNLCTSLPEYENRFISLKEERKAASKRRYFKNIRSSIVPGSAIAILAFLLLPEPTGTYVFAGSIVAGSLLYLFLSSRNHLLLEEYEDRIREQEDLYQRTDSRWRELADKFKVSSLQELTIRQEEVMRAAYSLEHGKLKSEELSRSKSELEDRCDLLVDQIMTYMQYFLTEEELNESSVQRLKEVIRVKKQEAIGQQEEMNGRLNTYRLQIEKLRWEIGTLEGNEEQLLLNKERYSHLEQKQKEAALELEAIRLALSTIQRLSLDIHDSFGQQLNLAVSDTMKEVTEHRYTDLKVDEKLEVKICHNGEYIPFDRLSAGTMDQVYLSLRLAAADLLLGKEELPLLLDDSFAYYDDSRMKSAIRRLAGREQLLIFTCHRREQRILEELGIPYHYTELSQNQM